MCDNLWCHKYRKELCYALKNEAYSNKVSFPKGTSYTTNSQTGIHCYQGTY